QGQQYCGVHPGEEGPLVREEDLGLHPHRNRHRFGFGLGPEQHPSGSFSLFPFPLPSPGAAVSTRLAGRGAFQHDGGERGTRRGSLSLAGKKKNDNRPSVSSQPCLATKLNPPPPSNCDTEQGPDGYRTDFRAPEGGEIAPDEPCAQTQVQLPSSTGASAGGAPMVSSCQKDTPVAFAVIVQLLQVCRMPEITYHAKYAGTKSSQPNATAHGTVVWSDHPHLTWPKRRRFLSSPEGLPEAARRTTISGHFFFRKPGRKKAWKRGHLAATVSSQLGQRGVIPEPRGQRRVDQSCRIKDLTCDCLRLAAVTEHSDVPKKLGSVPKSNQSISTIFLPSPHARLEDNRATSGIDREGEQVQADSFHGHCGCGGRTYRLGQQGKFLNIDGRVKICSFEKHRKPARMGRSKEPNLIESSTSDNASPHFSVPPCSATISLPVLAPMQSIGASQRGAGSVNGPGYHGSDGGC
ncbi:MAG: hypothetical protein BJ554DRAFT_5078, partial [Olpidium bornovanus]